METTFMTIHNLTPNANILYASESIVDILGYQPHEVIGRSCFDYFHPDQLPFARSEYNRGVHLDKAAVLRYASIMGIDGQWVNCECVFTIVHNVLVACTSIYKQDEKSEKRAAEAPTIRRLFASSPRDPRYHMLQHLSTKFQAPPEPSERETRAALILNRFTRTLAVMYATDAVENILGVSSEQIKGKSFYECIQENCLPDAIRCLESAKANDSIAYLRFWYRDPRRPEEIEQSDRDASHSSDSDEDGGVQLGDAMDVDPSTAGQSSEQSVDHNVPQSSDHSASSGVSTDLEHDSSNTMFDRHGQAQSSSSSSSIPTVQIPERSGSGGNSRRSATTAAPIEIEAVVSCTSDGLVVILRHARPAIPASQPALPARLARNGVFAAPWGAIPILPHPQEEYGNASAPDRMQAVDARGDSATTPGGPSMDNSMNSIREVAVFAWALTGINGNIASYGHGHPTGQAAPPGGFPVWDPQAQGNLPPPPENQAYEKWNDLHHRPYMPADRHEGSPQFVRHQQYVSRQMGIGGDFTGTDARGSAARAHLGPYIGEDGRGAGYFQPPHPPQQTGLQDGQFKEPDISDHSDNQEQGPSSGSSGDRYLWY